MVALTPSRACVPTFSSDCVSESVLAVGSLEGGVTEAPGGGFTPLAKPCSAALVALKAMAAVMAWVSAAFCSAASLSLPGAGLEGALSVFRAAAFGPEPDACRAGLLSLGTLGLVGIADPVAEWKDEMGAAREQVACPSGGTDVQVRSASAAVRTQPREWR